MIIRLYLIILSILLLFLFIIIYKNTLCYNIIKSKLFIMIKSSYK